MDTKLGTLFSMGFSTIWYTIIQTVMGPVLSHVQVQAFELLFFEKVFALLVMHSGSLLNLAGL